MSDSRHPDTARTSGARPDPELIARLIREDVRALSAYHVPDPAGMVKLDAMENPYGWPATLKAEWLEVLRSVALNRYPEGQGLLVQAALREAMDIPANMALLLGNGSDELIQMLALAVTEPGRKVLALDPGFVMYRMIARYAGMGYVGVPLRPDDFAVDLPAVLEAIEREQPALVFLAYPNNPTGNRFDSDDMVRIIEAAPGLVIVDEAYAPFTDCSFLGLLGDWPNLLVMRTLSKMGLAGLRLGYLVGPPAWVEQLDKVRLPYNINALSQASAVFALSHKPLLDEQARSIRAERQRLQMALMDLDAVQPYPSEANFILLRVASGRANGIFQGLKERGVLIKNLNGSHPMLQDCLRVTVGLPEENAAFMSALAAAIGAD